MGPPVSYFMSPGLCFLTWLYAHAGQRSYLATSGAQRGSGVSLSSRWIHPSGLMRNTEQFLSLLGRSSGCLDWLCQWKSTWKRPAAALKPLPPPTLLPPWRLDPHRRSELSLEVRTQSCMPGTEEM